jgi:hypothetical protein
MQNEIHGLLGNHREEGWAHQLPTHFTLGARGEETQVLRSSVAPAPSGLVAASLGGTVGTTRRGLSAGAQTYLGFGSLRSPMAEAPFVARPGHWYTVAAYRQELVFYDVFIEQPPNDADVAAARKRSWVGEGTAGAGWRTSRFAAEYRYAIRGREYDAQPSAHRYRTIAISMVKQ